MVSTVIELHIISTFSQQILIVYDGPGTALDTGEQDWHTGINLRK